MADQQHETVIHRIEAWRVATEAAEQTPDTEALVKERDGLLAELEQEIIDAYEHPTLPRAALARGGARRRSPHEPDR